MSISKVFSGDFIPIMQKMALVWCSVQFRGSTSTIQTDWNYKLQSMLMENTKSKEKYISH